jgi:hypothetical protein
VAQEISECDEKKLSHLKLLYSSEAIAWIGETWVAIMAG